VLRSRDPRAAQGNSAADTTASSLWFNARSPCRSRRPAFRVAQADQTSRRYAIQIPNTPPITKNKIDDIDSCPAPHRLGMKLPPKLPTNPPTYVGPLRIKSLFGLLDG
jgi:hypothetical protein